MPHPLTCFPPARLPACPFARLPVCPFARLPVYPFTRLPVYPFTRLPVWTVQIVPRGVNRQSTTSCQGLRLAQRLSCGAWFPTETSPCPHVRSPWAEWLLAWPHS